MKLLDRFGPALPPWSTIARLCTSAMVSLAIAVVVFTDATAGDIWKSLVERRDAIAGTLLSVHASLLGFAVATFAIILSVRSEANIAKLERDYKRASRQMWDALNSASWATGAASLDALVVMILAGGKFKEWVQHALTASLFATTLYVTLTLVGVLMVVHSLVVMLRPNEDAGERSAPELAVDTSVSLGVPSDDE